MTEPVEFSLPCDCPRAEEQFAECPRGVWQRLLLWRGKQLIRRALLRAGDPGLVLDLVGDGGHFWSLLAEKENRVIIAAAPSTQRFETACAGQSADVLLRVRFLPTSLLSIDLTENAVDSIFCMRLLHQVCVAQMRRTLLRELHRVTRDSVIVSLCVDGNFKAWRHRRHQCGGEGNDAAGACRWHCVVPRSQIEEEFAEAGFRIDSHHDVIPGYAMQRIYVLRKV